MRNQEDLIDFPVSWDWHRFYQINEGNGDPGDNLPISLPDVNGQASTDGGGGEPRKESNVTDPLSEIQQQLDSIKSENQWLRNRINYLYDRKKKSATRKQKDKGF